MGFTIWFLPCLVSSNAAMEHPPYQWRFLAGKKQSTENSIATFEYHFTLWVIQHSPKNNKHRVETQLPPPYLARSMFKYVKFGGGSSSYSHHDGLSEGIPYFWSVEVWPPGFLRLPSKIL